MECVRGSMSPAEVWRMRLDEAVLMCAARAELIEKAQKQASQGRPGESRRRPDGTIEQSIGSMDDLRNFLRRR